ncbi:hypothetical protein Cni_G13904 [Canna indica]|uniref:Uncharacterized protein n=1 Tax=Canna indica TaxID=4628 RepID=A0AAQ3KAE4_9LILI|nr:hypothetical protein Cni_G13904 [Canna indica]
MEIKSGENKIALQFLLPILLLDFLLKLPPCRSRTTCKASLSPLQPSHYEAIDEGQRRAVDLGADDNDRFIFIIVVFYPDALGYPRS